MRYRKVLMILIVVLALSITVSAQIKDSDSDGIKDEFDMCENTILDDGLPIIKQGTKYLGCSCPQIYKLQTADLECLQIFCEPGRPLNINERFFSISELNCANDYCLGNTLYEFPDVSHPKCVGGKVQGECIPVTTENSILCVFGQIGQKTDEKPVEKEISEIVEEPIVLEETSNYVQEIYDLILENDELKTILNNPTRDEFSEELVYLINNVEVEKVKGVEEKELQTTNVFIPYMEITIKPNNLRTLENVLIFEKVTKKGIGINDLLFDEEPLLVSNKIMVWLVSEVPEEGLTISYKSKNPLELESETLIVGEVKKVPFWKDWWPLILIPLIGYSAYMYIMRTKN